MILYNCLTGLVQLQESGVLHRDIKPSNILLDHNCSVKFCDFGLSRLDANIDCANNFIVSKVINTDNRVDSISTLSESDESDSDEAVRCVDEGHTDGCDTSQSQLTGHIQTRWY